jgi:hypothetical protein
MSKLLEALKRAEQLRKQKLAQGEGPPLPQSQNEAAAQTEREQEAIAEVTARIAEERELSRDATVAAMADNTTALNALKTKRAELDAVLAKYREEKAARERLLDAQKADIADEMSTLDAERREHAAVVASESPSGSNPLIAKQLPPPVALKNRTARWLPSLPAIAIAVAFGVILGVQVQRSQTAQETLSSAALATGLPVKSIDGTTPVGSQADEPVALKLDTRLRKNKKPKP